MSINKFFVYGTLRPDILAPWSEVVHKNTHFKLKYYKAYLSFSKLYFNKTIGYTMAFYDEKRYLEKDVTIGYILETNNLQHTLKLFDEIEGYPEEYDRFEVKCFNQESCCYELAYLYSKKRELVKDEELEDLGVSDYKK